MNVYKKSRLVRQFLPSRLHARPARETIEAVTITVFWSGIAFILGWEGLKRLVVGCVFDCGHMLAGGIAVDVVRARTSHCSLVTSSMETVYRCSAGFSWLSVVTSMSPEASTSTENCSACARCCAVSSASRAVDGFVLMVFRVH